MSGSEKLTELKMRLSSLSESREQQFIQNEYSNDQLIFEKEQLNEVVPLIAGLTLGGVLTAISVGMSAWGIYDIYKFISKYNEDPEKITDDQWENLLFDAILLFAPAIGKIGKKGLVKILPDSVISKGRSWMKTKVMDLIAKKGAGDVAATTKAIEKTVKLPKPALKQAGKGFRNQSAAIKWAKENPTLLSPVVAKTGALKKAATSIKDTIKKYPKSAFAAAAIPAAYYAYQAIPDKAEIDAISKLPGITGLETPPTGAATTGADITGTSTEPVSTTKPVATQPIEKLNPKEIDELHSLARIVSNRSDPKSMELIGQYNLLLKSLEDAGFKATAVPGELEESLRQVHDKLLKARSRKI